MKNILAILIFVSFPVLGHAQHEHMQHMPMVQEESSGSIHEDMYMPGFYGNYAAAREASGTSWQPESSPMHGRHFMFHDWNVMIHGYATATYGDQGGKRGADKSFSASMLMLMANKKLSSGTIGYRSMYSLDPLMGKRGYPLLFQTGETYDGIHPLIDRQHPHDFFMEEALTYSLPISEKSALFGYFGLPGEPALGPPAFMHRFSGIDNPEAPLGHHWLDSTHITFGVLTLGYVFDRFKIEGSVFRGREPDESRWDIETPTMDSYSARITYNPNRDLSFQASYGSLDSPEQLEPNVDMQRITVSAIYNRTFQNGNWQTTFAWGLNNKKPGSNTNALMLESAVNFMRSHTVFSRIEYVEKDELFEHDDPLSGKKFDIKKFSIGYNYDFPEWKNMRWGVGGSYSFHVIPDDLKEPYSRAPKSYALYIRLKF